MREGIGQIYEFGSKTKLSIKNISKAIDRKLEKHCNSTLRAEALKGSPHNHQNENCIGVQQKQSF